MASRYARPRAVALGALAAGAVAVAAILGTQGSSPHKLQTASHSPARAAAPPAHHAVHAAARKPAAKPSTPAPVHTTSTTTTTAHTAPAPTSADALENRGHAMMVAGNYQAAIPLLEHAVAAAPTGSLTYAYALFDLGHSLRLAGDPRQAVQVLWRRMQIPNQTGVVRMELQLALQELGQRASGGASPGASRPDGGGPAKDHGPRGSSRGGPPGAAADGGGGSQGNQD